VRIRPIAFCLGLAATPSVAHADYAVTVLQDIGGQGDSEAEAINASGQSVGYSQITCSSCNYEAVLWSPSGEATKLQPLGKGLLQRSGRHQCLRAERRSERRLRGAVVAVGERDDASGRRRRGRGQRH
jgi:hypothetical protein